MSQPLYTTTRDLHLYVGLFFSPFVLEGPPLWLNPENTISVVSGQASKVWNLWKAYSCLASRWVAFIGSAACR